MLASQVLDFYTIPSSAALYSRLSLYVFPPILLAGLLLVCLNLPHMFTFFRVALLSNVVSVSEVTDLFPIKSPCHMIFVCCLGSCAPSSSSSIVKEPKCIMIRASSSRSPEYLVGARNWLSARLDNSHGW
jgi:hypothetical protein